MRNRANFLLIFLTGLLAVLISYSGYLVQVSSNFDHNYPGESSPKNKEKSLIIWWTQAYVSGRETVISQLIREWEKSSGINTTLLFKSGAIDKQIDSVISPESLPDIAEVPISSPLTSQLVWEGKLADTSDVIEPIQDLFSPAALEGSNYPNRTAYRRSFYAIPIGMTTYNIHYWKPYLDRLGLTQSDIPQDWRGFWKFWKDVRDQLHQLGEEEIANFCIPLNKDSSEARAIFMQFLRSHNVRIFDDQGGFILDYPENRRGLIDTLSELSSFYQDGYIPPSAMSWSNSDNNIQFLDRQCLLVINGTLSIPLTQQQPDNPYTQKVRNRYFDEIATLESWPRTVNGTPVEILVGFRRLVIPANANNSAAAKSFLAYLLQPENLQRLVEQGKGRTLPPMPKLLNTPFWQNPNDPHLAAVNSLSKGKIYPYPDPIHPSYMEISRERIFGNTLESVIRDGVSPKVAADDAIARIKEIIVQYDQW